MRWSRKRSKEAPSGGDRTYVPALAEPPNAHRNAFIMMGLGGATIAAFGLAAIAGVFAPFFLGVVLTICVHPLRVLLEKHGVSRGIATGAVIVTVIGLLLALGYAMLVAFGQFGALLAEFSDQIAAFGQDVAAWLASIGVASGEVADLSANFDPSTVVGFVGGLIGGITGLTSLLVIVFTMLLLMGMDAAFVPTLLKQLYPARPLVVASLVTYGANVRRYMVATTVLGLAQGVVDWIALVIIGVPGAFIWGLLAFVCSFIPNVGYFLALIPPIIFAALVGGWPMVVIVIVVYAVINGVIQSVIQPRVIGKAVNLSQTITFFSVLFWAVVIGPIGAILAIPLTLLVRLILVDSNPQMSWIRPLLGELDETKEAMARFDADAKAERMSRNIVKPNGVPADTPPGPTPREARAISPEASRSAHQ
ncbi:AI-2E family transporter [Agromyces neolithicus]|uniref:AI-2E family transporter n=2 Tax=Agromyces neolithicus TaxID=269420 RepID=A0ABN2M703_9MICO